MTEDEMVGWYHRLNGHEFEQTPGDSEEQRSLACCRQQGHKESDTTEQLNNVSIQYLTYPLSSFQSDTFSKKQALVQPLSYLQNLSVLYPRPPGPDK